jgi:hypothetical protein
VSRRVSAVRDITSVRFLPDRQPATLVNMSHTGLLVESPVRLRVGSQIALAFEGSIFPSSSAMRPRRCLPRPHPLTSASEIAGRNQAYMPRMRVTVPTREMATM